MRHPCFDDSATSEEEFLTDSISPSFSTAVPTLSHYSKTQNEIHVLLSRLKTFLEQTAPDVQMFISETTCYLTGDRPDDIFYNFPLDNPFAVRNIVISFLLSTEGEFAQYSVREWAEEMKRENILAD